MIENTMYDELEEIGRKIGERRKALYSELSKLDKEISDINHYIEFYSLSASDGYIMSKMLKERFMDRRKAKNEIEALNRISVMDVGHIGSGKGRDDLNKLSDKHYTPRVLTELFQNKSH